MDVNCNVVHCIATFPPLFISDLYLVIQCKTSGEMNVRRPLAMHIKINLHSTPPYQDCLDLTACKLYHSLSPFTFPKLII